MSKMQSIVLHIRNNKSVLTASLVIISLTVILQISLYIFKYYVKAKYGSNLIENYE